MRQSIKSVRPEKPHSDFLSSHMQAASGPRRSRAKEYFPTSERLVETFGNHRARSGRLRRSAG